MNIKKISILSLIILITISILYDNLYTTGIISGEYTYLFPLSGPEGPQEGDKLTLNKDGTFQSDTWGNGTYEIKCAEVDLSYKTQRGRARYTMTIYRPFYWGEPRLSVIRDLNYSFEKR
jgi:hypothetical protein